MDESVRDGGTDDGKPSQPSGIAVKIGQCLAHGGNEKPGSETKVASNPRYRRIYPIERRAKSYKRLPALLTDGSEARRFAHSRGNNGV